MEMTPDRSGERGIALIKEMLPQANQVKREPCSASHITIGLQCGGSDGYSGISANPALGAAVDLLVHHGNTAILSETPEIYDAEHLLTTSLEHAREGADLGCTIAALNNLALVFGRQHEIDRALEVAREALSLGATYGDRHRVAALHANIADLLHANGRTAEALASLKESAALFADVDDALDRRPEIWKLVQW